MFVDRHLCTLALLLIFTPANGEWKPEYAQASQDRQQWFQSQQITPEAQKRLNVPFKSCCDNADVFKTRFRVGTVGQDQWEYLDGNTWKLIPADIIHEEPSLDNTPVLFRHRANGKELCFFKPQGGI